MRATPSHAFDLKALPKLLEGRKDSEQLQGVMAGPEHVLPDGVALAYLAPRNEAKPSLWRPGYKDAMDLRATQNAAAKLALSQIISRVNGSELLKNDSTVKSAITDLESLLARKASSKQSITVGDVKGSFTTLASATERLTQAKRLAAVGTQLVKAPALNAAETGRLVDAVWIDKTKLKQDGTPDSEFSKIASAYNARKATNEMCQQTIQDIQKVLADSSQTSPERLAKTRDYMENLLLTNPHAPPESRTTYESVKALHTALFPQEGSPTSGNVKNALNTCLKELQDCRDALIDSQADHQQAGMPTSFTKNVVVAVKLNDALDLACKSVKLTSEEVKAIGTEKVNADKAFIKATDAALTRNPVLANKFITTTASLAAAPVQAFTRAEMLFSAMVKVARSDKPNPEVLTKIAQEFIPVFQSQMEVLGEIAATLRDPAYLASIAPERRETMLEMAKNCADLADAAMAPNSPFMSFYQLCETIVNDPSGASEHLRQSLGFSDKPVGSEVPAKASATVSNAQPSIVPGASGAEQKNSGPLARPRPTRDQRVSQQDGATRQVYGALRRGEVTPSPSFDATVKRSKAGDLILSQLQQAAARRGEVTPSPSFDATVWHKKAGDLIAAKVPLEKAPQAPGPL